MTTEDKKDKKKDTLKIEDNMGEVSLQSDVEMIAALKLEIESVSSRLASSREEKLYLVGELEKLASELEKGIQLDVSIGCQLTFGGKCYQVVDVDTAWEVGQKVEKSFVDENAITLVLTELK